MEIICPYCQTKNIAQAAFCANCGKGLADVPIIQSQPQYPKSGAGLIFRKGIVNQILAILLLLTFFLPFYSIKNEESKKSTSVSMFETIGKTIPETLIFLEKIDNLSNKEKEIISKGFEVAGKGFWFKIIIFYLAFIGSALLALLILVFSTKEANPKILKTMGIINSICIFIQMILVKSILVSTIVIIKTISNYESFFGAYNKPDAAEYKERISELFSYGSAIYLGILISLAFIVSESFEKNILKIDYMLPVNGTKESFLQKIPNKYIFWSGILIIFLALIFGLV